MDTWKHFRDDAVDEGPEGRKPLPPVLKWSLVFLIFANIAAYIIVTCITVEKIDVQISKLNASRGHESISKRAIEPVFLGKKQSKAEESIAVLQDRQSKLIVGAVIEVMLDLVDLIDIFIGSFFIHIIYLVVKLFSIGMWSFHQVDLQIDAIWLIPLGICLLIIIILLRWYTALRKWVLALCILVSLVAWGAILIIRIYQVNQDIEHYHNLEDHSKGKEKVRAHKKMTQQDTNRTILLFGAFWMMVCGTMGLVAECLGCLWVGITFGVLHVLGFIFWVSRIIIHKDDRDSLFVVPLIYSILIFAIFIIYLFELYHQAQTLQCKGRRNQMKNVSPPPSTRLSHKARRSKGHSQGKASTPKQLKTQQVPTKERSKIKTNQSSKKTKVKEENK